MFRYMYLTCTLFLALFFIANGLDNGVGLTPPMGWLSWQRYRCQVDCDQYPDECISEKLYRDMADRLVEDGYRDAGYIYVNVDDCWAEMKRDKHNQLVGDKKRFPSGMKALGDYIHSKGLLYGIYSDVGKTTCAGYPGSFDFEDLDANTFAKWGVDSVKLDGCNCDNDCYEKRYPLWATAMNNTGRPMLYECSWPAYIGIQADFDTISKHCNYWRNYMDIDDEWPSVVQIMNWWADNQDVLRKYAKPGGFNDPDMLLAGNFGLSDEQARTQMSIWAIMAAPLYMSNDLRRITPSIQQILLNEEVIGVNQDKLGLEGGRILQLDHGQEWWIRYLENNCVAVVIYRSVYGGGPIWIKTTFEILKWDGTNTSIRDLWEHQDLQVTSSEFSVLVNPYGVRMVKLCSDTDIEYGAAFTKTADDELYYYAAKMQSRLR